jgi:hypothetical protein
MLDVAISQHTGSLVTYLPNRDSVLTGLRAAIAAEGIKVSEAQVQEATNAFVDYMADIVGFRMPSMHRIDLMLTQRGWEYWPESDRQGFPNALEISDALDAAFVTLGEVEPVLAVAGIAFLTGFFKGCESLLD